MSGEELSADDAWHTLRRHGSVLFLNDAFLRFRYGDGFSHARGFAFQLALAAVPLVIAAAGLSTTLGIQSFAEVIARTVAALAPGSSDALVQQAVAPGGDGAAEDIGELALVFGLLTAFLAGTTALAQLERGANRIYGSERDRPSLRKYVRAAVLTATAGTAMAGGVLFIVAGGPFGEAVEDVYGWGDAVEELWDVVRWPAGLLALVVAVTVLFKYAPRRRQPGLTWLAAGGLATVAAWLAGSGLLALYVAGSGTFGEIYGPLTAIIALLLWANVTGMALLGGVALCAQLEAVRAGHPEPLLPDVDDDGIPDALDLHPGTPRR